VVRVAVALARVWQMKAFNPTEELNVEVGVELRVVV